MRWQGGNSSPVIHLGPVPVPVTGISYENVHLKRYNKMWVVILTDFTRGLNMGFEKALESDKPVFSIAIF